MKEINIINNIDGGPQVQVNHHHWLSRYLHLHQNDRI